MVSVPFYVQRRGPSWILFRGQLSLCIMWGFWYFWEELLLFVCNSLQFSGVLALAALSCPCEDGLEFNRCRPGDTTSQLGSSRETSRANGLRAAGEIPLNNSCVKRK